MLPFKSISQDFGHDTMQHVKRYIRIKEGIAVFKTHLNFSHICKERKVVPQSLHPKRPVLTPEGLEGVTITEQRLIHTRLHEINASLWKKELGLFFAKRQLEHCTPELILRSARSWTPLRHRLHKSTGPLRIRNSATCWTGVPPKSSEIPGLSPIFHLVLSLIGQLLSWQKDMGITFQRRPVYRNLSRL
ncbi:hypothetical protein HPB51_007387 [Rhipicephalus microplus]|uniref:Uncharacterized protein n=1 Tax=Rhipicephalus microplus TaxID=6941 RepID=A0A9J6EZ61_RHIMP|nr:hypothetical protein HPB51_007387 [Rhipicephalus microplus]